MQSNVEDKEVLNIMRLDVSLVHEAVRRLNKGRGRHMQLETSLPYLNIFKHNDKEILNKIRERVEQGYVDYSCFRRVV